MSPEFVAEPYPLFAGDRTNVFAAPVFWRLKFQVSRIQIRMREEKTVRVDVHRAPAFWRDVTVEWVA